MMPNRYLKAAPKKVLIVGERRNEVVKLEQARGNIPFFSVLDRASFVEIERELRAKASDIPRERTKQISESEADGFIKEYRRMVELEAEELVIDTGTSTMNDAWVRVALRFMHRNKPVRYARAEYSPNLMRAMLQGLSEADREALD